MPSRDDVILGARVLLLLLFRTSGILSTVHDPFSLFPPSVLQQRTDFAIQSTSFDVEGGLREMFATIGRRGSGIIQTSRRSRQLNARIETGSLAICLCFDLSLIILAGCKVKIMYSCPTDCSAEYARNASLPFLGPP